MLCWRCGYAVADGAANCQTCGAEVGPNAGKSEMQATPDAGIRMPMTSPADTAALPIAARRAPVVAPKAPRPRKGAWRILSPLLMLFAAGVIMAIGSLGVWQFIRQERSAAPQAAQATSASAAASPSLPDGRPSVALSPADPAAAPASGAPAPSGGDPTGASDSSQLAATRKERDAAIVQRDAALAEVKQLQSDLARVRATGAPAPVVPAPPAADGAHLTQLQKDHDTLRFIVGSKKQLLADKVIESHLYLLPPPSSGLTPISLADTTEIAFDAKTYGLNSVKDLTVIPSSVWENTDFKYTISGSSVKFTILKPDAFRMFARYFVLMIE